MKLALSFALLAAALAAQTKTVTWTGWFSDEKCAAARAKSGLFTVTNPECAKTCIEKGAAAVFISEQAHALFRVKDYGGLTDDLGYHLEVTAQLDDAAGVLSIQKVKHLSSDGPACVRPRKIAAKQ